MTTLSEDWAAWVRAAGNSHAMEAWRTRAGNAERGPLGYALDTGVQFTSHNVGPNHVPLKSWLWWQCERCFQWWHCEHPATCGECPGCGNEGDGYLYYRISSSTWSTTYGEAPFSKVWEIHGPHPRPRVPVVANSIRANLARFRARQRRSWWKWSLDILSRS